MAVTRTTYRLLAWLLVATFAPAQAAPALAQQSPAKPRPRIGLALSGGGARGAAHIGVLKVLEELRVPVDYVAGTSMGALVGGLYATGMSSAELERVISEVDWSKAFADKIPREDRSFRRKRDDDLYLVKNKPGLDGLKLRFPPGMIDGQRIDLLLKKNTLPVVTVRDFDDLAIPYRAVAADIVNGEAVVLERGDLALAMRASMAIPTVFAPREIDGRLLVDGGIRQNLPIDVVRAMGAQVVIAVDISTPPMGREGLTSVISIATQLTTFASQNDIQRQVASLETPDVFIQPDLGTITVASFDRAVDAIPVGATGARGVQAALENLSVSPEEYRAHLAARPRRAGPPVIEEVRVVNRSRLADGVIATRMKAGTGVPLDPDRLEKALDQIYGLELFESVYYDVTREADRNVLTVTAQERAWGPNYVQAGVAAFEDFETPDFNVALAYTRTAIDRLSGEWRTGLQVGRDPGIFTELYQPVDMGLRKFVHVRLSASDQAVNQFNGAGDKVAELELRRGGVEAAVGRELGAWGEVRAGLVREGGEIATRVGPVGVPDQRFDTGEAFAQFWVDRLDDLGFPRFGSTLRARLNGGLRGLGSDVHYAQTLVEASTARTLGRYTGYVSGLFGTTTDGTTPTQSLFRLGGLTRLSGLERQELGGQHAALASAVFYRRFEALSVVPIYAGFSAEYGNVFQSRRDIRLDSGILSGSVLAGVSTFVGPICAAFGWAEGGRTNYYLTLGETLYRQRGGLGDR